jgi:DNA-binding MarR family transcriptional regulator
MTTSNRKKPVVQRVSPSEVRLEEFIGFVLRRAHFAAEAHYLHLAAESELTPRQFGVLLSLSQTGRSTIAELSERVHVDRNTIAEMVRRMVKRGLIGQRVPPHNRRVSEIWIAQDGLAALRKALPAAIQSQKEVLENIPPRHRGLFRKYLQLIADRYENEGSQRRAA